MWFRQNEWKFQLKLKCTWQIGPPLETELNSFCCLNNCACSAKITQHINCFISCLTSNHYSIIVSNVFKMAKIIFISNNDYEYYQVYLLYSVCYSPFTVRKVKMISSRYYTSDVNPSISFDYFLYSSSKPFILNHISTLSLFSSFLILYFLYGFHGSFKSLREKESAHKTKSCLCQKRSKGEQELQLNELKLLKTTTTLSNCTKTHSSCDMNKTIHCYLPLSVVSFSLSSCYMRTTKMVENSLYLSYVKVCFVLSALLSFNSIIKYLHLLKVHIHTHTHNAQRAQ